jgi:hypothetical protein
VDSRLHHMLDMRFNEPFWKRGDFPAVVQNGSDSTVLPNPWAHNFTVPNAAPFDQEFYLIMNVAVGGTNGWFPDGAGGKPWLDQSGREYFESSVCAHRPNSVLRRHERLCCRSGQVVRHLAAGQGGRRPLHDRRQRQDVD